MIGTSNKLLAAALAVTVLATPLAAQQLTSDSFAFLEAVKKRDGNKATELLDQQSTTVVNARERGSGEGALHMVARGRDLNWLGFLISKGARVESRTGTAIRRWASPRRSAGWRARKCCSAAAQPSIFPTAAARRR